jgi:hypothetical protein
MANPTEFRETVAAALDDWAHCWAVEQIETHPHRAVLGVRVAYLDRPIRFCEIERRCSDAGLHVCVTALESVGDPETPRLRLDVRRRDTPRTILGP